MKNTKVNILRSDPVFSELANLLTRRGVQSATIEIRNAAGVTASMIFSGNSEVDGDEIRPLGDYQVKTDVVVTGGRMIGEYRKL